MYAYIVIFNYSLEKGSIKKLKTMNKAIIKSKINVVEARIKQIQESDLFTEEQKTTLIQSNQIELDLLSIELAKNCEVFNFEIL